MFGALDRFEGLTGGEQVVSAVGIVYAGVFFGFLAKRYGRSPRYPLRWALLSCFAVLCVNFLGLALPRVLAGRYDAVPGWWAVTVWLAIDATVTAVYVTLWLQERRAEGDAPGRAEAAALRTERAADRAEIASNDTRRSAGRTEEAAEKVIERMDREGT